MAQSTACLLSYLNIQLGKKVTCPVTDWQNWRDSFQILPDMITATWNSIMDWEKLFYDDDFLPYLYMAFHN